MLIKIDHVNIVVVDIDKSIAFYEMLGFVLIDKGPLKGKSVDNAVGLSGVDAIYAALKLANTETKLELIQYNQPVSDVSNVRSKANQVGFRHLAFNVDNIEETVSKLKESGCELFSDIQIFEEYNKKLVYFYSPDGDILELAEFYKA